MCADSLLKWHVLTDLAPSSPVFFWDSPGGRFIVTGEPWRIIDPSGKPIALPQTIWIDRLFLMSGDAYLADWRAQRLWRFEIGTGSLSEITLPQPSDLVAMHETIAGDRWVLIRSQAQLVCLGQDWSLKKRLGTRLGIASEKRLGFEWPDDALFSHDGSQVLLADSGNNRLVRLDTQAETFFSMPLPIRPAFILYDGPEGWLISDGADDLVWGSDRYGPIRHDSGQPMQSCRILRDAEKLYGTDEAGNWGEIRIQKPEKVADSKILVAGLLMRLEKEADKAPEILTGKDVATLQELLRYSKGDAEWLLHLTQSEILTTLIPNPFAYLDSLDADAHALHDLASGAVNTGTAESNRIEGAVVSYRLKKRIGQMIEELRAWYFLMQRLRELRITPVDSLKKTAELVKIARTTIKEVAVLLDQERPVINQTTLITLLVRYKLAHYVILELGEDASRSRITPFNQDIIRAIELPDVVAADIHLQRGETEPFKSLYERAIAAHPEFGYLPLSYIDKLLKLEDLEAVEQNLASIAHKTQERINYRLSNLYRKKGDNEKAAYHLRKELSLFPNWIELIVPLLEISEMDDLELSALLDRALIARKGQIDTHYHLGKIYLYRNQAANALESFLTEFVLFPENENALVQIINLIETRPEIKKEFTQDQVVRLWKALRAHLLARKTKKTHEIFIPVLLFILNRLPAEHFDETWLLSTKSMINRPEWLQEVEDYLVWIKIAGNALAYFQAHPEKMAPMLEQLSCREAVAKELLDDPDNSLDQKRLVSMWYPEAMGTGNNHPMAIDFEKGFLQLRRPFPYEQANWFHGDVVYTQKEDHSLYFSTDPDLQDRRVLWTFTGQERPFWAIHQKWGIIIVWDEMTSCMREISSQGQVLLEQELPMRPVTMIGNESGFYYFISQGTGLQWASWRTGMGLSAPFQGVTDGPYPFWRLGYEGMDGLCRSKDGTFWRFQDGLFCPLFKPDQHRFKISSCHLLEELGAFIALELYTGYPYAYLTLIDLNGNLLQRISLPWKGIDCLVKGGPGKLVVGEKGQWLAELEYSLTGSVVS
jgi:tetratricopeptide (TPR) repeat protein